MSSNLNISVRTSDLAILQGVLDDAGYDSTSSLADPKHYNIAVRLLFKLYRDGMTSPAALSIELSRHFGKTPLPSKSSAEFEKNRKLIQGVRSAVIVKSPTGA
ncbi:hypothetical protein PYR71_07650 [Rhizobium sp. MC63]|uniref:Uncharacterized protein n=1 Tax=Rhizobium mulingense TaxID=3031128 RepID=A0ACC6MR08_9HYPH|nr:MULTISPECIES: hypothetical protein [unclassified Rhizobium]MDF0696392.1 hypothetical protein [Rhizobium sp. MC63]MEA3515788.1 hypothetical protein [Rhizobium sp. MJ31]MEB3046840.1 hypothetical protein [Rhizobium sp. MJ21]